MYKRDFSIPLGSLDTFFIIYKMYYAYPFGIFTYDLEGTRLLLPPLPPPPPPPPTPPPPLIRTIGIYKTAFR